MTVVALVAAGIASVSTAAIVTNGFESSSTVEVADGSETVKQLSSGQNPVAAPTGAATAAPNWAPIADAVQPTVVAIQVSAQYSGAEGSGVITNAKEGQVVTNNHVVEGAAAIQVILSDGRIYKATVMGTDALTDLAVLKITEPPADLKEAVLGDSETVSVGEPVMAVGNPLGYDNTVTTGIVSAVNRPLAASPSNTGQEPAVINLIQTDAAINPGNSGGPLFNTKGEVVGINSSIASVSTGFTDMSGSIGLGFAIPSNLVSFVAPQLVEKGEAQHAVLGVSLQTTEVTFDGATRRGAQVVEIVADSAATRAKIQVNDVIVGIDGHPITETAALQAWVRSYEAGREVTLTIIRATEAIDLKATLGIAAPIATQPVEPDMPQNQIPEEDGQQNWIDPFGMFNW